MKLMLEIDVYGAMYHSDDADDHPGKALARNLRWLAEMLEPKTIEQLEHVHNDLHAANGAKIGSVLVD